MSSNDLNHLYKEVGHYNTMIGNPPGDEQAPASLIPALFSQTQLIEDEVREFVIAINIWANDPTEKHWNDVLKEWADIQVTLAGWSHRAGIPPAFPLAKVHEHNMLKFFRPEDLQKNEDHFRSLELNVLFRPLQHPGTGETLYTAISAHAQQDIYGNEYPAGKQLKPVGFPKLDWSEG